MNEEALTNPELGEKMEPASMKSFTRLYELHFRSIGAHAGVRSLRDEVSGFRDQIRELKDYLQRLETFATSSRGYQDDKETTARNIRNATAQLEQAIAARDIAEAELAKLISVADGAGRTKQRLKAFLEENRHLIPQGVPNGI